MVTFMPHVYHNVACIGIVKALTMIKLESYITTRQPARNFENMNYSNLVKAFKMIYVRTKSIKELCLYNFRRII